MFHKNLDGISLIILGLIILLAKPVATLAAYVAIVVGAYSIYKKF